MSATKSFRYPGVKPFSETDKHLFFGREEDTEKLCKLINVEQIVALYGKSGLGKSSLLQAGVMPKLRQNPHFQTFYIRFGNYKGEKSLSPTQFLVQKINEHLTETTVLNSVLQKDDSLWAALKKMQAAWRKEEATFVLMFDQFEEFFTYPEGQIAHFEHEIAETLNIKIPQRFREHTKKQMLEQGEVLEEEAKRWFYEPLNVKCVLTIRADKLSLLNSLTDYLPNVLSKTYLLQPLEIKQAEDAILNPAYYNVRKDFMSPPFDYSDEALALMLNFLSNHKQKSIESFQLQILCQYAENIVIEQGKKIIEASDLQDVENIYRNYYENQLKKIDNETEQQIAHLLIEEGLIFEEEQLRLSLYEGQLINQFNASRELLKKLADTHLLRAEPNSAGALCYEVSHDSLIAPILHSKNARKERERQEKKQKQLKRQIRLRFSLIIAVLVAGIFAISYYAKQQNEQATQSQESEKLASGAAKQNAQLADSLEDVLSFSDNRLDSLQRIVAQETEKRELLAQKIRQITNNQSQHIPKSPFIAPPRSSNISPEYEKMLKLKQQLYQMNNQTRLLLKRYAPDSKTYELLYNQLLKPYEDLEKGI